MQERAIARLNAAIAGTGSNMVLLFGCAFLDRLGIGIVQGISTNFMVNTVGLSGQQVLWQTGLREIPGLSLVLIAALTVALPLSRQASLALALMGVGYALFATANSFAVLVAVSVLASVGFHAWIPIQTSLGLALSDVRNSGRVLGNLVSVGALASIGGMALTAVLAGTVSLRALHVVAGSIIIVGALLVLRIPVTIGANQTRQARFLLRRRYWLYYVLTFFEGSRTQVFHAFGTLILVRNYGLGPREISLLLTVSAIVNTALTPYLGRLIDVVGERATLSAGYVLLALCFVGYATVHNALFLSLMLIGINLLVLLQFGLSSYVNRIAPRDELTPTLNAGVSINHVTSVSMSLLAGTLLDRVGYEALCYGAAGVIMISVPFALMIGSAARAPAPLRKVAD